MSAATAPNYQLERELLRGGLSHVAGIDEVGRGPLAGPVAAAAVILNPDDLPVGLRDSKQLSPARRASLAAAIFDKALAIALAFASAEEVDRLNIRAATLAAMARAATGLSLRPDYFLIDGRDIPPGLQAPSRALIKGDTLSLSIAAAAIIAKVTRDALMARLDPQYPAYGFAQNAGYGTLRHLGALRRLGPTPLHRASFNWRRSHRPGRIVGTSWNPLEMIDF